MPRPASLADAVDLYLGWLASRNFAATTLESYAQDLKRVRHYLEEVEQLDHVAGVNYTSPLTTITSPHDGGPRAREARIATPQEPGRDGVVGGAVLADGTWGHTLVGGAVPSG